jgi:Ribonuclease G/E
VDVDTGQMAGGDSKRVSRQANLGALSVAARLLRLKGLGGLVVFDLAGRGHDGAAILAAARAAFASDNPGVAISQISRFGTLELTIPRRRSPVLDRLADGRGALTAQSAALQLARRVEDAGRIAPAAQLEARCRPEVAMAFEGLAAVLRGRLGGRITVVGEPGWPVDRLEVISR